MRSSDEGGDGIAPTRASWAGTGLMQSLPPPISIPPSPFSQKKKKKNLSRSNYRYWLSASLPPVYTSLFTRWPHPTTTVRGQVWERDGYHKRRDRENVLDGERGRERKQILIGMKCNYEPHLKFRTVSRFWSTPDDFVFFLFSLLYGWSHQKKNRQQKEDFTSPLCWLGLWRMQVYSAWGRIWQDNAWKSSLHLPKYSPAQVGVSWGWRQSWPLLLLALLNGRIYGRGRSLDPVIAPACDWVGFYKHSALRFCLGCRLCMLSLLSQNSYLKPVNIFPLFFFCFFYHNGEHETSLVIICFLFFA